MKIRYLKLKNWLLVSLMSLFGLQACHCHKEVVKQEDKVKPSVDDRGRVILMYGVPTTPYRVDQKASDDATATKDNPVPPKPREPQVTVYGTPTVDFSVKGRVVDEKGNPVKGVQVMLINSEIDPDNLPDTPHWMERMKLISDTTDNEGNFNVHTSDRPWESVRVLVRDIDEDENGIFEKKLMEVDFGEPKQGDKPVSSWNLGERKAEVTVEMKHKDE